MQRDFQQLPAGGVTVTRPPPVPASPLPSEPTCCPQVACPLIKKSVLVIIGCLAHSGEQLQRRALAAAAKYRHVTLVFTPSDGPRSDMRAKKVGQQPKGLQMAREPAQGPPATTRRQTHSTPKPPLVSATVCSLTSLRSARIGSILEKEPKLQDRAVKQAESSPNRQQADETGRCRSA